MSDITTIRVTEPIKEHLQNKDNASAYVRRLIEADMKGQDRETIGLQLQIETLEKQAQAAAEKEEMYQSRVEELRELKETVEGRENEVVEKAREKLDVPADPTNLAIQRWAEKAGLSPEEFAARYNTP